MPLELPSDVSLNNTALFDRAQVPICTFLLCDTIEVLLFCQVRKITFHPYCSITAKLAAVQMKYLKAVHNGYIALFVCISLV